ncbi:glycosyltransferase family 8 protein [Butyrivibrio sp. XPD2002]|uniref:glycosyltransferase family 8 protein n=1 Tax=Butyrivibrio sp. XPD2002 TaxID=1280665 RepID=UPI0004033E42|nr:glycosyltransferase family 8 protein [Butyrivibrio sp. XPD2002]
MNILIAVNDGYFKPARVMLTSLCVNNTFEEHNVYLLYHDLNENSIENLRTTMKKYNCMVHPVYVDDDKFNDLPVSHHFSIETYYRFLMQTMVPSELERILWLDADMIIKGDLKEFYYQDFDDNYIAVCKSINKDPDSLIRKLCLPQNTVYFNAGIILFNLTKIRNEIDPRVYFEYAQENAEKITWLDQDILNAIFCNKKIVHGYKKYNYQHFTESDFSKQEKSIIDNDTVVLHYIGNVKPWHFKYIGYTLKYYRRYARAYESIIDNIKFDFFHYAYLMKRKVKR